MITITESRAQALKEIREVAEKRREIISGLEIPAWYILEQIREIVRAQSAEEAKIREGKE